MANHRPAFRPLLDEATLARMRAAATQILARTGLAIEHDELRAQVLRHTGFSAHGRRVRIAPERVADWEAGRCGQQPIAPPPDGRNDPCRLTFGSSAYCAWTVTEDGLSVRPMTREDVIAGTRLLDALRPRGVAGGVAGVPCDVPLPLQPLEQFLIGARYSAAGGSTPLVADIATAEVVREMDRVYGRPFGVCVWCPSPLVFGGPQAAILWHYRKDLTWATVGSMPVMGLSGPCDPVGVMTLSLAESIGGAAVLRALFPEVPVGIAPHPEPGDLATGALVMGTPEWELLDLMHRDVHRYYGDPHNSKMLHTTASLPNAQAQIERATGALLGILGGYSHFGPLGVLGVDEVWCPAQAMLDLDLVAHAARVGRGVDTPPELDLSRLPDVVEEVVAGEMVFAEHESTARTFRSQYHIPELLQRSTRAQWCALGHPDVVREAARRAKELVASHSYEPPADVLREIERLYEWGKRRLLGQ